MKKNIDIIYGVNPIMEALKKEQVEELYSDLKYDHPLVLLAQSYNITIKELKEFKTSLEYKTQKVIAIIKPYKIFTLDELLIDEPKNILFLDRISDPHNLGAIIRSAAAFNINHIILPKDHSAKINEIVHKTSVGTTFKVKISYVTAIQNVFKKLKSLDFWLYSFDSKGEDYNQVLNDDSKRVLIFGSEGKGIRESIINETDFILSIPINKDVESLNVSVSASIIMEKIYSKIDVK